MEKEQQEEGREGQVNEKTVK